MLKSIKESLVELVKDSWFKIIAYLMLFYLLYMIYDSSIIHYNYVNQLEQQIIAGEISYEHADFMRSATHEQIVYQIGMAIIVSMVFVVGMLMQQNSKLRERVRRIDFRLWKLDRNIEDMYELQRLSFDSHINPYPLQEVDNVTVDEVEIKMELERLQEENSKLIKDVQELERQYKAKMEAKKEKQ